MTSLGTRPPRVINHDEVDPLRKLRKTLRQHYRNKRRYYASTIRTSMIGTRRLFSESRVRSQHDAARFLSRIRRPTRRLVASWTGIYQHTIDQVLGDMIARCRELKLRLAVPEEKARQEFTVLLTVQAMNYLQSGGHRVLL